MYWIKLSYERNEYIVDLDQISAFAGAPNGKITFWLPDSAIPIIINQQSSPDGYKTVMEYIQKVTAPSVATSWIKILYERNEYVIDLNRISTFCHAPGGRITFWLPDSSIPIIINKQGDPDSYEKILEYVKEKTGYSF